MRFAWIWGDRRSRVQLERAAEMGYAPAQAHLAMSAGFAREAALAFSCAQTAAAAGNRAGIFQLADCFDIGRGCNVDKARALELLRSAAEWEDPQLVSFLVLSFLLHQSHQHAHNLFLVLRVLGRRQILPELALELHFLGVRLYAGRL
jgi:TPR repeat protein